MPLAWPKKDPTAVLDFQLDWTTWLGSDTINSSTWTVPAGLTMNSNSHTNTTATIWLAGGTTGQTYDLINHITTTGGRADERTVSLLVIDR